MEIQSARDQFSAEHQKRIPRLWRVLSTQIAVSAPPSGCLRTPFRKSSPHPDEGDLSAGSGSRQAD